MVERFVKTSSWSAAVVDVLTERVADGLLVGIVLTESPTMLDADDVAGHPADELGETVPVTMQVVQAGMDRATGDEGNSDGS